MNIQRLAVRAAVIGFLLVQLACSTMPTPTAAPTAIAPQANGQEVREFRDADQTFRAHNYAIAIKKLSVFLQRHPKNSLTDGANFDLGQIYFEQGDYNRAARYWLAIVDGKTVSPYYERALVGAASAEAQLGRYDDALKILNRLQITPQTDRNLAAQAVELSSKLNLQKGNAVAAVDDLLAASDMHALPNEKQNLFNRAVDVVNGNMNQKDLETLLSSKNGPRLELQARYRLGQLLYEQKSWGSAKDVFNGVIAKFPASEQAKSASNYISTLDSQEKVDGTTIGVVLPLTGKYSQMGYKTLRGVQMGLGIFNHTSVSPVKLAIIDSEGNPDVARRGVERLVSEDHVVAIIGDILSKTAQAVAVKAQELGVPCVSLSQKQGLNDIGDFIFRSTLTSDMQMRALVDAAMDKGYKRFAILYPNDTYGTEYATLFWDNVLLKGGEITGAQSYQPDETDFRDAVQRLVGTYYAEEDRGKELQFRIADFQKEQKKDKDQGTKNPRFAQDGKLPKDILPPVVDFDALFIPDGPKAIGQVAPMLAYNDIDKMPLLGTNIWDTPQIVSRGGKFVEDSIFTDDFFTDNPSPVMKRFMTEFKSEFNYSPDVFEAQGFDAATLVNQTLRSASYGLSRVAMRDHLANASVGQASSGPLKMSPQREVEKLLTPLTVTNGKIVKLETGKAAQ